MHIHQYTYVVIYQYTQVYIGIHPVYTGIHPVYMGLHPVYTGIQQYTWVYTSIHQYI